MSPCITCGTVGPSRPMTSKEPPRAWLQCDGCGGEYADTAGLTQSDFIRRQLGMRYSLGKNPASVSAFGK